VSALWTPASQRRDAATFFSNRLTGLPVHRLPAAFATIHEAAGIERPIEWRQLETSVHGDTLAFTPNFAALTGIEALESCRTAGHKGDALSACLDRALDVGALTK
jgi:hypothetical protein